MDIIESNKLITEFMGEEWVTEAIEQQKFNERAVLENDSTDIRFNTSWDWLIPVYLKIMDEICGLMDGTNGSHENSIADMGLAILDGDKREAIKQGVIAIEWYNSQKS